MRVDSQPVDLELWAAGVQQRPGAGGLATIRIVCEARAANPTRGEPLTLEIVDGGSPGALGWREIVVRGDGYETDPPDAGIDVAARLTSYPTDLLSQPLGRALGDGRAATRRTGADARSRPGCPATWRLRRAPSGAERCDRSRRRRGGAAVPSRLRQPQRRDRAHRPLRRCDRRRRPRAQPGPRQDGDGRLPRRHAWAGAACRPARRRGDGVAHARSPRARRRRPVRVGRLASGTPLPGSRPAVRRSGDRHRRVAPDRLPATDASGGQPRPRP